MGFDILTLAMAKAYSDKKGGYSKKELKTIIPTTEIPFEVQDGMGSHTYENVELSDIAPEKTYKVMWDGVEYICIAFAFAEDAVVIGRNPMTGDNGEPFTFMLIPGVGLDVYAYSDAPTHTVSITTETETIVPIDQSYLPGVKEISLADYGIDIATIVMSGQKISAVSDMGIWSEIDKYKEVVFVATMGQTFKITPTVYAFGTDGGAMMVGFTLVAINGNENLMEVKIVLVKGDSTTGIFCVTTTTNLG